MNSLLAKIPLSDGYYYEVWKSPPTPQKQPPKKKKGRRPKATAIATPADHHSYNNTYNNDEVALEATIVPNNAPVAYPVPFLVPLGGHEGEGDIEGGMQYQRNSNKEEISILSVGHKRCLGDITRDNKISCCSSSSSSSSSSSMKDSNENANTIKAKKRGKSDDSGQNKLTLIQRSNLLEDFASNPDMKKSDLAVKYKISKPRVTQIIQQKESFKDAVKHIEMDSTLKRVVVTKFSGIDNGLFDWIRERRNAPISVEAIKTKAIEIALELEIGNFLATNLWLSKFVKKHKLAKQGDSQDYVLLTDLESHSPLSLTSSSLSSSLLTRNNFSNINDLICTISEIRKALVGCGLDSATFSSVDESMIKSIEICSSVMQIQSLSETKKQKPAVRAKAKSKRDANTDDASGMELGTVDASENDLGTLDDSSGMELEASYTFSEIEIGRVLRPRASKLNGNNGSGDTKPAEKASGGKIKIKR